MLPALILAAITEGHSPNGKYGISGCEQSEPYSDLMLAARMTLPHFSVSSAMNLPNSAGVIDFGTLPKSAIAP